MKKSDLEKNHRPFDDALTRYRKFLEKVVAAKYVVSSAAEKRDVAESVLLRLCAHWESFVAEHLVDCVNRDSSRLGEYFSLDLPPHPTKALCQALVIGDRYRDFRSMGDLKRFTKKVLPDPSNPFLQIKQTHLDKLDEVYIIRNYLAHYSGFAARSLWNLYKKTHGMTYFSEPGKFLLSSNAKRLWAYFDAFDGASADMKGWY